VVKEALEEVASEHHSVMKSPKPFVRFTNFGDSSLDFQLFFWSRDFVRIENVKSDLRFAIDAAFRLKNIEVPFPQRDVWIRSSEGGMPEAGAATEE
ncbi:MAG: potassium transporter KefA, partial [Bacteroidota bacterium]